MIRSIFSRKAKSNVTFSSTPQKKLLVYICLCLARTLCIVISVYICICKIQAVAKSLKQLLLEWPAAWNECLAHKRLTQRGDEGQALLTKSTTATSRCAKQHGNGSRLSHCNRPLPTRPVRYASQTYKQPTFGCRHSLARVAQQHGHTVARAEIIQCMVCMFLHVFILCYFPESQHFRQCWKTSAGGRARQETNLPISHGSLCLCFI